MALWTLRALLGSLLLHSAAGAATVRAAAVGRPSDDDATALLQLGRAVVKKGPGDQPNPGHYWPHSRGNVHHYSHTPYKMPMNLLHDHLAWKWDFGNATIVWSVVIDAQKNLYVSSMNSIVKFSPDGHKLWQSPLGGGEAPTLVGNTLVSMQMMDALAFALDLDTGKPLWTRRVWQNTGAHIDFVEAHSGVAVVSVGMQTLISDEGAANKFAAGISTSDGSELWHFEVECGLWTTMALFPDDETTIFQDMCGGVYRVGLHNGTLLWHTSGEEKSYTDGGAMLGPDGSTYTCSNPANSSGKAGELGLLRKYRLSDGARLWSVTLPYPCVNFPAVSADGRSVIVAPGASSTNAKTKSAMFKPPAVRRKLYREQLALGNKQRAHYGMPDLPAAIMAFDTKTGELRWRHEVEPWGRLAFARDERRANAFLRGRALLPHCWPSHWSAPTVDDDGTVYIARSTGDIYVYDPKRGEAKFHIDDGAMMAGAAFAPGMMAITSCSSLFVFKMPEL